MSIAFNSNPGDPTQNSYPSVQEFKDYWTLWQNRQPAWIATASDSEIESALVGTTLVFDSSFEWTGASTTPGGQGLAWPRVGMTDITGFSIPTNVIPTILKYAVCEFAGQAYDADRLADDDAEKFSVQGVQAGDVRVNFQRSPTRMDIDAADIDARLKGPEFNYLSRQVPEAVRRMVLAQWYTQPTIKRPLVFRSF